MRIVNRNSTAENVGFQVSMFYFHNRATPLAFFIPIQQDAMMHKLLADT